MTITLFPRCDNSTDSFVGTSDATGTLSVAAVETGFVAHVYEKLASIYDCTFGPVLHPGRLTAIQRLGIHHGDHILEVGVGTGINVPLYPRTCHVTGIDLSDSMLRKAHARIARFSVGNVQLLQMDAAEVDFASSTFDIVYAPYLISVVPDPVRVASEMVRVCRPGGRIVVLNHFRSTNPLLSRIERIISPMTVHIGFKADVDLRAFLAQTDLRPASIETVNFPRLWSLVTCIKE